MKQSNFLSAPPLKGLEQAEARKKQLEDQIAAISQTWSLSRTVMNIQAFKGVGLIIAATLVAEVGTFSPFDNPRKLMA